MTLNISLKKSHELHDFLKPLFLFIKLNHGYTKHFENLDQCFTCGQFLPQYNRLMRRRGNPCTKSDKRGVKYLKTENCMP